MPCALAVAVLASLLAAAGEPPADVPEKGSAEAIAAATTEPRFLSSWVASVPDDPKVPSPTDYLGHIAGAPGELSRTAQIYGYYRALAAATPRVRVETIGKTEEGRDILLVFVGEADTLAALDRERSDMAALADPRRTDEAEAERVIARSKPLYMLHGGLHSTETGSPEMLMELAYRLAVSQAEVPKLVRERLVTLINPVAEPDGRDRAVDWYYRYLKGKTDYDHLPPISPPFWGKYVRHDNNRDGIQRRLALTRATQDAFLKWHPIVVHDLHESIPLLSIWTGTGPYNVNLDPITSTEWHAMAFHEVTSLTAQGMPGVWTWGFGEGWSFFYADSVAINHNAIGRGYETFGNGTAETVERRIDPERSKYAGTPVTERAWYRPLAAPSGSFRWSLRNNVNYQETGVLAALQYTALHGRDMLRNFWRTGRNAIRKGETEKPYAIAIREAQGDRRRLATMVNLLRAHGIEVSRATAALATKQGEFPAGTFVVRLDQPYRSYALDLLTPQKFPADKTPYTPYDDVGWALPASFGVEVTAIDDPAVRGAALALVEAPVAYTGGVRGQGSAYLVRDTGQEALLAARVRLSAFKVEAAESAFSADGVDYAPGSWVIADQPGLRPALEKVAAELDLDVRAAAPPDVRSHALDLPRLAVLQTWSDTQSAGWVRMVFDDEKVPYTVIMDEDVRRGGLHARFDVILFPNTGDSLKEIVNGIDPAQGPLAYTSSAAFPALGTPSSSPDITGGLTWRGVGNLEEFVRDGGVLVTLGGASVLPLDGGFARDVRHARTKDLYTPGSELTARFRHPGHPLSYGYKEITSVFREDRTPYDVRRADQGRVVLQWGATLPKADPAPDDDTSASAAAAGDKTPLVVSGGIKGGSELEGKPAILDIPTGRGRVVAFEFDPIHRYLTLSDFRLVWNALLNWNDLPAPAP